MFEKDIIIVIVSAFVTILINELKDSLKRHWFTRHINNFWNFRGDKPVLIVLPKTARHPDHDSGMKAEKSLNLYSAKALIEISNLLSKMKIKTDFRESDSDLSPGERQYNLVLIGGRRGNEVCREICNEIVNKLEVYWFEEKGKEKDTDLKEIYLSNRHGKPLMTKFTDQTKSRIECDYGLVLKFRNPWNPKNTVIILAGNYGTGTLAATRAAIDNQILSFVNKAERVKGYIGFTVQGSPKDLDVKNYSLEGQFFKIM
jgi:hypothetical protein